MNKIFAAVIAAAALAGVAVMIPGLTPQVEAHNYGVKGDRLDAHPTGTACSQRAWPYFEASCLRDTTSASHEARPVRLVAIDHLPSSR